MQENILVSVIIPTYNSSGIIERGVKSALNQTHQNLEVIVVDDASTDDTQEKVLGIKDERIKCFRLPQNSGVSAARNEGVKRAKGSYIALLDSDDEYLPEMVEENLKVMLESGESLGLVCSNIWITETGSKEKRLGQKGRVDLLWHTPSPSTWFLRREVFEENGLSDEDFRVGQDREFLFRFHISEKFGFKYIEKPLVIRYKAEGSLSSQGHKYIDMRKIFLKKHKDALQREKKFLAYQLYRLGKDLAWTGKKKEARPYFLKAFLTYPLRMQYFVKWLKSFF